MLWVSELVTYDMTMSYDTAVPFSDGTFAAADVQLRTSRATFGF